MKPERAFVAAGRAAQHCPELLRRGPSPADLLPRLARLGEALAGPLASALAPLLGGEEPTISGLPPRETAEGELAGIAGPLAANALFATGIPGLALLASIEGRAVLRLVDRAFGGKGDEPGTLPDRFPLSADLLITRLEERLSACLGTALGQDSLPVLRRDPRLTELAPYPAGSRLAVLGLDVVEPAAKPWTITLALPLAALPRLLGTGAGLSPREGPPPGPGDPAGAPFGDIALNLTARIVNMNVPLSGVASLAPGMVLPVAVARAVPLFAGATPIALGTVGTQDERLALRLTQIA